MPRKSHYQYGSILSDLSCSDVPEGDDEDDEARSVSSYPSSTASSSSVIPCYEASSNGAKGIYFSVGLGLCWAVLALLFAFTDSTGRTPVLEQQQQATLELVASTNNQQQTQAKFFEQQIINHNNHPSGTFRQRYYENFDYWKGPGHPILLILGGEGSLERMLYPFVSEVLAEQFGAVTFNPEHRYFGESIPVLNFTKQDMVEQLTPRQAIQDYLYFVQMKRIELGCGPRGSSTYCPVMTVGGSYAGLLSVLLRKSYPDIIDMAYAASPCLLLFQHAVSPYTYYEYITQIADRMSHGCSDAVKGVIAHVQKDLHSMTTYSTKLESKATEYGICADLPNDMTGSVLAGEIVGYTSANFGNTLMDYYPPSPELQFFKGCSILQNTDKSVPERVKEYIHMISGSTDCYSLASTTPIEQEDDGDAWGALCCYLVPMIGKSNASMWPSHPYSLQKDADYCKFTFDMTMDEQYLEKEFALSDLTDVTRLVLTNGLNDGWYPTSYETSVSDGIVVLTMENGAHHSDLTHQLQADTPDVERVHTQISELLESWLQEIAEQ